VFDYLHKSQKITFSENIGDTSNKFLLQKETENEG